MTVYAQQANERTVHVFASDERAELYVASEKAKAVQAGRSEPIWVVWDAGLPETEEIA